MSYDVYVIYIRICVVCLCALVLSCYIAVDLFSNFIFYTKREELYCGAAGLCARVRACAGAAESLHTYITHNVFPLNLI